MSFVMRANNHIVGFPICILLAPQSYYLA